MQPEVDQAINEICNEAIVVEDGRKTVEMVLDDVPIDEQIKKVIILEFESIIDLLNFNNTAYEIFRQWLIDGRNYYHVIIDEKNAALGIRELRNIDPRKIRKVREVVKQKDPATNTLLDRPVQEYYVYNEQGIQSTGRFETTSGQQGIKIHKDSVIHTTSGLMDGKRQLVMSYLQGAIKPMNQLRSIEDATLIYHLCLIGDTRVQTPMGYKYISEIREGDLVNVFTAAGLESASVSKQWMTGKRDVFTVKSRHHSITGTDNHPVLVYDSEIDRIHYVSISDLRPEQHSLVYEKQPATNKKVPLSVPRQKVYRILDSKAWGRYSIADKENFVRKLASAADVKVTTMRNFLYGHQYAPLNVVQTVVNETNALDHVLFDEKFEGRTDNEIFVPDFVDENFARLFGFLLGDGSISDYSITFAEGTNDRQNRFYASLLETYFGNCRRQRNAGRNYSNWTTSNTLGVELLASLGFHNGSTIKRIPEWVFTCEDAIKIAFIAGFCDADAHIKTNTKTWAAEIELSNKRLIEDIKVLWSNLGFASGHIRHRKRQGGRTIKGNLKPLPDSESWSLYISMVPLSHLEPIVSIEPAGTQDVWDIEVDHAKHNFIANEIVVHNSRAPERRAFYVDTGSMPHIRAKQYMEELINQYRTKLSYNSETGEVKDSARVASLNEDFWFQRREGGRGTEIVPISGGTALPDLLATVEVFENKLLRSLHVPLSRLKPDDLYSIGRATEISKDEIKFSKFIDRLRNRFSMLFTDALEKQLILKNIVTPEDFDLIRNKIKYKYLRDNLFSELKDQEIMRERANVLMMLEPFIGRIYSWETIRKDVCKQTDEEIEENNAQIAVEMTMPQYMPPEEEGGNSQ